MFTRDAKAVFTELRQVFVKALKLNHIDPKHYIQIETYIFSYVIGTIRSQLILDDLVWWYLVAFFSQKLILAEIW